MENTINYNHKQAFPSCVLILNDISFLNENEQIMIKILP